MRIHTLTTREKARLMVLGVALVFASITPASSMARGGAWVKGYIVSQQGDTAYGYIYKDWRGFHCPAGEEVKFSRERKGVSATYTLDSLRAFGIGAGERYVQETFAVGSWPDTMHLPDSCIVYAGNSSKNFPERNPNYYKDIRVILPEVKYAAKRMFARILFISTFYTVYETYDVRHRFFCKMPNGVIQELLQTDVITPQNAHMVISRYKDMFRDKFSADREAKRYENMPQQIIDDVPNKIDSALFDERGIVSIVSALTIAEGGKCSYVYCNSESRRSSENDLQIESEMKGLSRSVNN